MAFWKIASNYGVYITVFMILENLLMLWLIIDSIIRFFRTRKLEKLLKDIK